MVRQASAVILFGSALAAGLGCHGFSRHDESDLPIVPAKQVVKPPKEGTAPGQILAVWNKQIIFGTNPANHQAIAGLSGRVYLLEKEPGHPLTGDGTLTVELYNDTPQEKGTQSKLIETWKFPPEILTKLVQTDRLGAGYSLSLPWSTYEPGIKQVHLTVHYEPKKGEPLAFTDQIMTLEHTPQGSLPPVMNVAAK
jgi:hypothetical protein